MFSRLVRGLRAGLFFLPLAVVACAAPTGKSAQEESLGTTEQGLEIVLFDPCSTQKADAQHGPSYVTLTYGVSTDASEDAAYAYREGCKRFIVDLTLDPSNLHGESILIESSAHDLPSSKVLGGTMPNNQLDCSQYKLWVDHYEKKGTGAFTKVDSFSFNTIWVTDNGPAHCELNRLSGPSQRIGEIVVTEKAESWTYRTTVKATLRGVAQPVEVRHEKYEAGPL